MIKIFKKLNLIFIDILLFVFYFVIIGFAKIIYIFSHKEKYRENSYWQKPQDKQLDVYSTY